MKNKLIIFVRNPYPGEVKSRLAATIGDEGALEIYQHLLSHTHSITKELVDIDKVVYYSDTIEENDMWSEHGFEQKLQSGSDLGARIENAFKNELEGGADHVVIIGSDCFELTEKHIAQAFDLLDKKEVVIGPANDGGYYLLGLNHLQSLLFKEIEWGTDKVLSTTLQRIMEKYLDYSLLPLLNDVDREEDVPQSLMQLSGLV